MKLEFLVTRPALRSNKMSATERKKLFEIQIWTVDDVALFLDSSKGHIYNLVSQKMIPFYKKGKRGRLYFIPTEILDWIKERGFR
jgi:excisionase family DNA binding protein